jgi:FtsH Extracellular
MRKWQQQVSIGYFIVALLLLFALQSFFASARVETITYSQFRTLARKGLITNVVIGEKIIRGEIRWTLFQRVQRRDGTQRRRGDHASLDRCAPESTPFVVLLQGCALRVGTIAS